jgi:hypothetical protein
MIAIGNVSPSTANAELDARDAAAAVAALADDLNAEFDDMDVVSDSDTGNAIADDMIREGRRRLRPFDRPTVDQFATTDFDGMPRLIPPTPHDQYQPPDAEVVHCHVCELRIPASNGVARSRCTAYARM